MTDVMVLRLFLAVALVLISLIVSVTEGATIGMIWGSGLLAGSGAAMLIWGRK